MESQSTPPLELSVFFHRMDAPALGTFRSTGSSKWAFYREKNILCFLVERGKVVSRTDKEKEVQKTGDRADIGRLEGQRPVTTCVEKGRQLDEQEEEGRQNNGNGHLMNLGTDYWSFVQIVDTVPIHQVLQNHVC